MQVPNCRGEYLRHVLRAIFNAATMGLTGKKDYKELYGRGSAQVVSMLTFNFAGPSLNTAKVQKKLLSNRYWLETIENKRKRG